MASDLADFKARLPIVDIVRRYVRLARNGPVWKGLCPFHQEKTPSFTVTETRGTYHCFGCQAHGNAIDFVMAMEGLDFTDAVRRCAELTGLEAPKAERGSEAVREQRKSLASVLEMAAALFREALATTAGGAARAYLERRGLEPATVERFELGHAGGGRAALTRALTARGVAVDALVDTGLTIVPDDGGEPYDRFRDRLMFPIRDRRGTLVGFGGRALEDGAKAKYLNSPEGPLFKKRELLYGAHLLDRRAGRGTLHVVEGYMDVIALAERGVAAVAPLGTAVTTEQLQRAWRLETAPVVCLDGDAAGKRAAGRLAEVALGVLEPGLTLRFATLPPGDDPDSLIRRDGREAFEQATARAEPLVEVLWQHTALAAASEGPEARALARRRLRDLVRQIRDADVRREYGREFRARLGDERSPGRPGSRPPVAPGVGGGALAASLARVEQERASALLAPLLEEPALVARFDEALADLRFETRTFERLKECLLDYAASDRPLDTDAVRTHLVQVGLGEVVRTLATGRSALISQTSSREELVELYGLLLEHHRLKRSKEAERELLARALMSESTGGSGEAAHRSLSLDALLNMSTRTSTDPV